MNTVPNEVIGRCTIPLYKLAAYNPCARIPSGDKERPSVCPTIAPCNAPTPALTNPPIVDNTVPVAPTAAPNPVQLSAYPSSITSPATARASPATAIELSPILKGSSASIPCISPATDNPKLATSAAVPTTGINPAIFVLTRRPALA